MFFNRHHFEFCNFSKMATVSFCERTYADICLRGKLVELGPWFLRDTRDQVEEPMGFAAFAPEARVLVVWTNQCGPIFPVDVM